MAINRRTHFATTPGTIGLIAVNIISRQITEAGLHHLLRRTTTASLSNSVLPTFPSKRIHRWAFPNQQAVLHACTTHAKKATARMQYDILPQLKILP